MNRTFLFHNLKLVDLHLSPRGVPSLDCERSNTASCRQKSTHSQGGVMLNNDQTDELYMSNVLCLALTVHAVSERQASDSNTTFRLVIPGCLQKIMMTD